MEVREGEVHVFVHQVVWSLPPSLILSELLHEAFHFQLDASCLLECDLDGLLQDHVWTVVHLHTREPHTELLRLHILVQPRNDELEFIDPIVC